MNTHDTPAPGPAFDPEKAARLRTQAQEVFTRKFKKVERYLCIWMTLLMAVAGVSAWNFGRSTNLKYALLYGIVLLVAIEGSVLIRLWYWIVNNKLSVLREIKLLRLDLNLSPAGWPTLEGLGEKPERRPGLSSTERAFWQVVILALALFLGAGLGSSWPAGEQSRMSSRRTVTVEPGGQARVETEYSFVNLHSQAISEFSIFTGGTVAGTRFLAPAESGVTDGVGRPLPVRLEPAGGANHRLVIGLHAPVAPGERFTLRLTDSVRATVEAGVWTVGVAQNWGYQQNHYEETIILPAGAQVISTEPAAEAQETREGRPQVRFKGEQGPADRWWPVVKFRLP